MRRVFVDTGGFVGLLVAEDRMHVRAQELFDAAHTDKSYSLCDALSFVVMERLGVTEAISFDRHFREYGRFTIL